MTAFEHADLPEDTPQQIIDLFYKDVDIFMNDLYQVDRRKNIVVPQIHWNGGPLRMVHLSIKRRDKEAGMDWRHLQIIKNELVGPENEAVEIYPAESRLVDTANQFHLWVAEDPHFRFPFGFSARMVSESSYQGSKQRPFERVPDDLGQCEAMLDNAAIELNKFI